jgi:hypothetical protein
MLRGIRERMMQTKIFGLVAGIVLLGACSDEADSGGRKYNGTNGPGANDPGTSTDTGPKCPADLGQPTNLAPEGEATDVGLADNLVFFRVGTKVVKIGKDGSGRADVYTSPNMVNAYTDGKTIVAVESPDPPNAVFKVSAVGSNPDEATQIDTEFVVGGAKIFGADAESIYTSGETEGGDNLYKFARQDSGGLETLAETGGVVSDPQIAGGFLWYVKDSTEIFKLALTGGEPTLVTSVPGGCGLAVGANKLYCTTNAVLEERDLAGANPRKLGEITTSKVPVGFGTGIAAGDVVVARSSSGDGPLKNVLRSVGGTGEKVIACGRETIGAMAADATSVVWTEPGKGVFIAPVR